MFADTAQGVRVGDTKDEDTNRGRLWGEMAWCTGKREKGVVGKKGTQPTAPTDKMGNSG